VVLCLLNDGISGSALVLVSTHLAQAILPAPPFRRVLYLPCDKAMPAGNPGPRVLVLGQHCVAAVSSCSCKVQGAASKTPPSAHVLNLESEGRPGDCVGNKKYQALGGLGFRFAIVIDIQQ
jgi:hypothetical protein